MPMQKYTVEEKANIRFCLCLLGEIADRLDLIKDRIDSLDTMHGTGKKINNLIKNHHTLKNALEDDLYYSCNL